MINPPNIVYSFMKLFLKIRRNPKKISQLLDKAGIKKNMKILDFGCGIGSYSIEAAKLVGKSGKIIAADQNDMMLKEVEKQKRGNGLSNIDILKVSSIEEIKDRDFDYIFLIDMLHFLDNPKKNIDLSLKKLKTQGKLFIKFDHFKNNEIDQLLNDYNCLDKKKISGKYWLLNKQV